MELQHSTAAAQIVALCALVVAWALWHWRRHAIFCHAPPKGVVMAPGAVPLLGHTLLLLKNKDRCHDLNVDITRAVGPGTWALSVPFAPLAINLTSPAAMEHVLKRHFEYYEKGPRLREQLGPVFGKGIFTSDGEEWSWQRKVAGGIFHSTSFKLWVEGVFADRLDALVRRLEAVPAGATIDMQDLMYRLVQDIFMQIVFGVDLNGLEPDTPALPMSLALEELQEICQYRFVDPFWHVTERVTGQAKRVQHLQDMVNTYVAGIITQRRQEQQQQQPQQQQQNGHGQQRATHQSNKNEGQGPQQNGQQERDQDGYEQHGSAEGEDFITQLLGTAGPDGKLLSDEVIIDMVINLIIAGRDTTAQALTWAFNALMDHPAAEQKLLDEVQQLQLPAKPSYSQLRGLKRAHATLMEVLRLWPTAPADIKFCVKADVLPDGAHVPVGAAICYNNYSLGRRESIWGADALDFRPERFLDLPAMPNAYTFTAFNAGPRLCLGKTLAELEGVYFLVGVLRRFQLSRSSEQVLPVQYVMSTTLPMKGGLKVHVHARNAAHA